MKKYVGLSILLVGAFLFGYYLQAPKHEIANEKLSEYENYNQKEIKQDTNISFRVVNASFFSVLEETNIPLPETGVIPNAEVATQVAVAISTAIYGDGIKQQMPMQVCLVDGVWKIEGTVRSQKGGSVYLEINKKDGKINFICHSK